MTIGKVITTKDGAIRALKETVGFDRVIDYWKGFGFYEFTVDIGGDKVTFRVYESGDITER